MEVIKTLFQEAPSEWKKALTVAGAAGIGNAAILGIINRGASIASSATPLLAFRLFILFALCMLAFYFGKRYSLIQASVTVEEMVKKRLLRVANKIRNAELIVIENLGRGDLYTKVAQDTSLVSQSGLILVNAAQQSFVLLFCLLYIAWLSVLAFAATMVCIGIGVVIYARHAELLQSLLHQLGVKEAEMIDDLGHVVDGFKEIRLNQAKNDAVFATLAATCESVRELKVKAQVCFCVDIMFSDLFFYSLLAVVVFLLPRLVPAYGAIVLMITAAILFIIGPLQMVVQAAPVFQRAKTALENLQELEGRLDRALAVGASSDQRAENYRDFGSISLQRAGFSYTSDGGEAFSVGPLDLTIERGELVFVVGGNGSGKTTAIKLLTGLYAPQYGALKVDNRVVDRANVQAYRELYSTVFGEFHLFDRLYGLEGVDPERVKGILKKLELDGKTSFENGRFTNTSLSTGQRKRLALAVCLLEDKEILVFDEWAADQDPHFRKYFYEVVLRELKAQGKTVIAVTHDEHFWHVADRIIKMEYGAIADDHRVREGSFA
ncbi:MAG TPA: cyclic peptide export ABC transporter [Bryobacteraceae bacterium]